MEQVTYGEDSSINLSWSEDLDNFDLGKAFSINNSFQIGRDSNNFKITFKKGLYFVKAARFVADIRECVLCICS